MLPGYHVVLQKSEKLKYHLGILPCCSIVVIFIKILIVKVRLSVIFDILIVFSSILLNIIIQGQTAQFEKILL